MNLMVIDSGAGGLSVAREILGSYPCQQLTYVSDPAFFPYGGRSLQELMAIVASLLDSALQVSSFSRPDVIVLACNTASTLVLEHLRSKTSIPIVGVVPAVKPAGTLTKTGVFGVLATPQTVASPYLERLKMTYCPSQTMIAYGAPQLVSIAEQGIISGEVLSSQFLTDQVRLAIEPLFAFPRADEMDVLVLACTHFPILKEPIAHVLRECSDRPVQLIDSGAAIARQVGRIMGISARNQDLKQSIQLQILGRIEKQGQVEVHKNADAYSRFCFLSDPFNKIR